MVDRPEFLEIKVNMHSIEGSDKLERCGLLEKQISVNDDVFSHIILFEGDIRIRIITWHHLYMTFAF